jgi:hypothetical protein
MSAGGWIAVDLDGTLAEYRGWPSDGSIGKPIPAMVDRVRRWLADGVDVRIFTARIWPWGTNANASTERTADSSKQVDQIMEWCIKQFGRTLPVTCVKDYGMIELWDDRAVQVIPNTGQRADGKAE